MYRKCFITMASFLLSVVIVVAQNGQCTEVIQTALANAQEACGDIGRNQACFGHIALDATSQSDAGDFEFSNIGDIVDVASIQTLELGGYDSDTGAWGVVLMQVQANLPGSLPGQNVTIILFGDTTLRNAASSVAQQVPPEQQQSISASGAVNIRALPSTVSQVIGTANPADEITATGRNEAGDWIRVTFDGQTGWIASFLLDGSDDLSNLLVVEPETEQYGPMQAFYLSTGIGQPACNEVPQDGMLVQTPEGAGTINLAVNEVEVEMGSTVYFSINEDRQMSVTPVEGAARVRSGGQTQTAIAGTRVELQLDDDYIVMGEPSEPESYIGDDDIEDLPYDVLERDIEWDEGLDDDEFEDFLEYDEVYENLDLEDLDEVFDYIDEFEDDEDFNLLDFLIDDLGYEDFDDDLQFYFEDEGYDFDDYDSFIGDDDDYYYYDDSDTDDGYDDDYSDEDDYYGDYDDDDYYDDGDDDGYYDDGGDDYYDDSGDGYYDDY